MWFSFIPLLSLQALRELKIQTPFRKPFLQDTLPEKIICIPCELPELDYQDLLIFLS
uniref:Uncharacterized protein n=1 Tax=viral metagenome TaxID=1070528 RepID=A0A6C0FBP4_9ZZZZ